MKKCVICHTVMHGHGYNASPLADGECCDNCNEQVIEKRLVELHSDYEMQELLKKYHHEINNDDNLHSL